VLGGERAGPGSTGTAPLPDTASSRGGGDSDTDTGSGNDGDTDEKVLPESASAAPRGMSRLLLGGIVVGAVVAIVGAFVTVAVVRRRRARPLATVVSTVDATRPPRRSLTTVEARWARDALDNRDTRREPDAGGIALHDMGVNWRLDAGAVPSAHAASGGDSSSRRHSTRSAKSRRKSRAKSGRKPQS
jgi:hypothetical protein